MSLTYRHFLLGMLTTIALGSLYPNASLAQPKSTDAILVFGKHDIDFNSKVGIPIGGLFLTPGISYDAVYDDNIFLKELNLTSDFISIFKPGVAVQTNWGRHEIYAGVQAVKKDYRKNSQKDSLDYGGIISGRYDITYETYIDGYIKKTQSNLSRGSEEDVDGSVPIKYDGWSSRVGFTRELSYVQFKAAAFHDNTERKDNTTTAVAGDFIKRSKNGVEATLIYEFYPKNNLFVTTTLTNIDYDLVGNIDRDVNKGELKYGANFSYWDIYSGSIYFGHLKTDYSHIEEMSDDPFVGLALSWDPSRLTKVSLSIARTYADGNISADQKIVVDNTKLALTHQITNFVTGSVTAGMTDNSYEALSGGTLRENTIYSLGADAKYMMSDNLSLKLGYDFRKRVSDTANEDYKNNRILFSLTYMH
jgi:hypothetical protein